MLELGNVSYFKNSIHCPKTTPISIKREKKNYTENLVN